MFVHPPFIKCPYCGNDTFGIISIQADRYYRRCQSCWRPNGNEKSAQYQLPKLNKRVIFLDQFVISYFLAYLDPQAKGHTKVANNTFWKTLYEKVSILSQGQFILCPISVGHTTESLLSRDFTKHKQVYEMIAYDTSFKDIHSLRRYQIVQHATDWLKNEKCVFDLRAELAVYGKINAWQDHFYVSPQQNYLLDTIKSKREHRDNIYNNISRVFSRWQNEQNKSYNDWFIEEGLSFGSLVLEAWIKHMTEMGKKISMGVELSIEETISPLTTDYIRDVERVFRSNGLSLDIIPEKTRQYFLSRDLLEIPFIKISSSIWASIAQRAAHQGKKTPPNRGMKNDIDTISTLMPYCDAMFIDKECHSLLNEQPMNLEEDYQTRLFSLKTKKEFLDYLDEIEASATDEHLRALNEVYGDDYWRRPFSSPFKE